MPIDPDKRLEQEPIVELRAEPNMRPIPLILATLELGPGLDEPVQATEDQLDPPNAPIVEPEDLAPKLRRSSRTQVQTVPFD
jgi:hypothetical protein